MSENRRERSFGAKGLARSGDFRANLVMIFLDNLNPVVDQKGLWGIFKAFGIVRDLYLSPKSKNRRSCYAFVRFATIEEAERVARLVNGMHVYGWPIVFKMADLDWSNRKKDQERPQRKRFVTARLVSRFHKEGSGPSYVEVVQESQRGSRDQPSKER
ncbi:hypothetical protein Q3G72_031542 [Acer saccharum]|nr:hypothetical protein Q3G72_031542 [Acer saccharum]